MAYYVLPPYDSLISFLVFPYKPTSLNHVEARQSFSGCKSRRFQSQKIGGDK